MDGTHRGWRWTSLKQRLGFNGIGCCGATWSHTPSALTIIEAPHQEEINDREHLVPRVGPTSASSDSGSMMNLAMALAAERNLRDVDTGPTNTGDVKSLIRLFEETDGVDWKTKRKERYGDTDWRCCVCMERSKGAAFIPCGHAYCRVCSRELWVNRGSCPLCNRSIDEILDIY